MPSWRAASVLVSLAMVLACEILRFLQCEPVCSAPILYEFDCREPQQKKRPADVSELLDRKGNRRPERKEFCNVTIRNAQGLADVDEGSWKEVTLPIRSSDNASEAPPGDAQSGVLVHVSFLDDPLTMHEAIPGIVDGPEMSYEIRIKSKAVDPLEIIDFIWQPQSVETPLLTARCLVPISAGDRARATPNRQLPHCKPRTRLFEEATDGFGGIA
jgi:hypothetical protein